MPERYTKKRKKGECNKKEANFPKLSNSRKEKKVKRVFGDNFCDKT